jgi:hypothetical protein
MRELERQAENLLRALAEGSMAQSFCKENKGRLRRVEGTQREMAWGMRAEVWAAWGRMSTMRAESSLSQGRGRGGLQREKGGGAEGDWRGAGVVGSGSRAVKDAGGVDESVGNGLGKVRDIGFVVGLGQGDGVGGGVSSSAEKVHRARTKHKLVTIYSIS